MPKKESNFITVDVRLPVAAIEKLKKTAQYLGVDHNSLLVMLIWQSLGAPMPTMVPTTVATR